MPKLFDEEQKRFIFNTPQFKFFTLYDFIASDREKFATRIVELYPCLDKHFHFHRLNRSNKASTQSINTGDIEAQQVLSQIKKNGEVPCYCYLFCVQNIAPALIFFAFFVILTVWAWNNF